MDDGYFIIGPLVVSKALFSLLLPVFSTLLGTALGAGLGYLSTSTLEQRKYRRERRDQLLEKEREALEIALESVKFLVQSLGNAASIADTRLKAGALTGAMFSGIAGPYPDVPPGLRPFMSPEASELAMFVSKHHNRLLSEILKLGNPAEMPAAAQEILNMFDAISPELARLGTAAEGALRAKHPVHS